MTRPYFDRYKQSYCDHSCTNKRLIVIILSISSLSAILLLSNQCATKDIFKIVYSATDNNTQIVLDNSSGNNFSAANIKLNIGFVKPTFTAAAYNHAFYDFYHKYDPIINKGENVTIGLNLLTSKIPDYEHTFIKGLYSFINSSLMPVYGSKNITLVDHVKELLPHSNILTISDPVIDNGSIFNRDGTNKYDILLFGHEEYVTQQEYDNLKRFVANGGTMVLIDGNIFYAQVRYDRNNQTVTLVKGHGWAFNGKSAWISVAERYENETRQWVGSNFYHFWPKGDKNSVRFSNNPFNYSVLEENYVSNPKDKIILDYGSSDRRYKIATYELEFGKGKVIGFGIAGERPLQLKNSNFFKFFDEVLLKYAIPKFAASGSNSTTQYNATKIADT